MGMFDSVFVACPKCGEMVEFQSKAGVCELKRYRVDSVPVVVADDLQNDVEECKSCGTRITLLNPLQNQKVKMQVVVNSEDEEWD